MSKRWFCLDTFIEDMPTLEGWDRELFDLGLLQLDKDFKQHTTVTKLYSRKTCIWVSKKRNNSLQPSQMRKFLAISPTGATYKRLNKAKFCRIHGLDAGSVSKCLNGHKNSHKGWTFEYLS